MDKETRKEVRDVLEKHKVMSAFYVKSTDRYYIIYLDEHGKDKEYEIKKED